MIHSEWQAEQRRARMAYLESIRRTGQTTRMLTAALAELRDGAQIAIVFHDDSQGRVGRNSFLDLGATKAEAEKVLWLTPGDAKKRLIGRCGVVVFEDHCVSDLRWAWGQSSTEYSS